MLKFEDLKIFVEKIFPKFTKCYYKKIEDIHENSDENKRIIYRSYGEKTLETVIFEEVDINENKKEIEKLLGIFIDEQIPEHPLNEMLISSIKDITEEKNFDFIEEIYNFIVFIYYVSRIHKNKFINNELNHFLHKLFYFFIDINKITYMELDKNIAINKIRDFFIHKTEKLTSIQNLDNQVVNQIQNEKNQIDVDNKQVKKRKLFLN